MAFGGGQRQCIGMKFAYSVIQLLFVKVLRKYEIHKGEHFNESLRYRDGFVRDITDSINVELVLRRSP
jgi:cytochrome P450